MWDLIGALMPYLYFFLEMEIFSFPKKITSVGSSAFQKNLQRLDQPTLVFFCIFEKNYTDWIKWIQMDRTTINGEFLKETDRGLGWCIA